MTQARPYARGCVYGLVLSGIIGWLAVFWARPAAANNPIFVDSGQSLVSIKGNWSRDVALGDLDGDGDVDAFVVQGASSSEQGNVIWLNDGSGAFSESSEYVGDGDSRGVALADLDGDGDLDAFITNAGFGVNTDDQVWLNQGGIQGGTTGAFAQTQTIANGQSSGLALGDLDGDTDPDALVLGSSGPQVWWNDGSGSFSAGPVIAFAGAVYDVALGDLDGDLDRDIVFGSEGDGAFGPPSQVFWNDWNAPANTFTAGPALPTAGINNGVALAQLDDDSNLDVFIASSGANKVWWNNGDQTFTASADIGSENDWDVALGDLDGDGKVDAYVARFVSSNRANGVWLNNGNRSFSASPDSMGNWTSEAVALADLNGDNKPDAFVANSGDNTVWLNTSTPPTPPGTFVDSGQLLSNNNDGKTIAVAIGDLDGDSDLDAVSARFFQSRLWLNQGGVQAGTEGVFSAGQSLPSADDVILGDVDGDNDLDIFLLPSINPVQLWLNQGGLQGGTPGQFLDSGQRLGTGFYNAGDLGDVDGDGDLDAFLIHTFGDTRLYLNQGGTQGGTPGQFLSSGQNLNGIFAAEDIHLADLDGDTDLDAFVDDLDEAVWLNQGVNTGVFSTTGTFPSFVYRSGLGDFDGDSDPDLFAITDDDSRLLFNQGGGQGGAPATFADSGQSLGQAYQQAVAVAELNNDGHQDVFVTGYNNINIWLNDGSGNFSLFQTLGAGQAFDAALGDLDGDGDVDALVSTKTGDRVFLNGEKGILPNVFLSVDLIRDSQGRYQFNWWPDTNARLRVLLSHPATATTQLNADFAYLILDNSGLTLGSDNWQDPVMFQAGETSKNLTAFSDEPGGAAGEIWNVYQGTTIIPSPVISYTVDLNLVTPGVSLTGPDTFDLIFHSPNALARNCFLEGLAFMLGLNSSSSSGVQAAAGTLDLNLFRAVRDQVLAGSPQGRYYTALYSAHSTELLQITAENGWLAAEGLRVLQAWSPALQELVSNPGSTTTTIDAAMVKDVEDLLRDYKALGSPALRLTIEREEAALNLPSFVGQTMDQALVKVEQRPVTAYYLPLITKD